MGEVGMNQDFVFGVTFINEYLLGIIVVMSYFKTKLPHDGVFLFIFTNPSLPHAHTLS